MRIPSAILAVAVVSAGVMFASSLQTARAEQLPKAFIDGEGPGWRELTEEDFVNVNCKPDTWSWKDGVIHCTGQPIGVTRTKMQLTNFELVVQCKHLKPACNSGVFVW